MAGFCGWYLSWVCLCAFPAVVSALSINLGKPRVLAEGKLCFAQDTKDSCECRRALAAVEQPFEPPFEQHLFEHPLIRHGRPTAAPRRHMNWSLQTNRPHILTNWHVPGYVDRDFDDHYPLTNAELEGMALDGDYSFGNYQSLLPVMRKLEAGGTASILVLGGSMTWGHSCVQVLNETHSSTNRECAWPARFARWLQTRFPQGRVELHNAARCGATAEVNLALITQTLDSLKYNVDVSMIDLGVNGAATLTGYEQLVRSLLKLVPQSAIFGLVAFPDDIKREFGSLVQLRALKYYDIPTLDYHTLVNRYFNSRGAELWQPWDQQTGPNAHPDWKTHQLIADMMANLWAKVWEAPQSLQKRRKRRTSPDQPGADQGEDAYCSAPLVHYSAELTKTVRGDHWGGHWGPILPSPKIQNRTWSLYQRAWNETEDRQDKPGWITESNGTNASINFAVRFGSSPTLLVIYLRSYAEIGMATISIPAVGWSSTLNGRWTDNSSQLVVEQISLKDANLNLTNAEADVEISLTSGSKFKITDVTSC